MTSRTRKPEAFTLVEMLVVVFVIAILVTLVVSVARDVMRRAGKDQTRTNMEVVLTAIEEYHKTYAVYPVEADDFSGMTAGWTVADWEPYVRARGLYHLLEDEPRAREILSKLKKDAIMSVSNAQIFADGFGKHMDYRSNKSANAGPLLESAGPDGDFLTKEDNIRSDDR